MFIATPRTTKTAIYTDPRDVVFAIATQEPIYEFGVVGEVSKREKKNKGLWQKVGSNVLDVRSSKKFALG